MTVKQIYFSGLSLSAILLFNSGCATKKWETEVNRLQQENSTLQAQMSSLTVENNTLKAQVREVSASQIQAANEPISNFPDQISAQEKHNHRPLFNLEGLKKKGLKVRQRENGIEIELSNSILFGAGSANLSKNGVQQVESVGRLIKKQLPNTLLLIEGFTDNVPLKKSAKRFKSNVELSEARAEAVKRILADKSGISSEEIHVKGYGESHPIASNRTEEGRKKNRRVNIVILESGD